MRPQFASGISASRAIICLSSLGLFILPPASGDEKPALRNVPAKSSKNPMEKKELVVQVAADADKDDINELIGKVKGRIVKRIDMRSIAFYVVEVDAKECQQVMNELSKDKLVKTVSLNRRLTVKEQ